MIALVEEFAGGTWEEAEAGHAVAVKLVEGGNP